MFEVTVRTHFDSAHYLRGYQGRCENLHGHRWQVETAVRSQTLDSVGLAMDFKVLKRALQEIIESLDHCCLNDQPAFSRDNPSSENIARFIYDGLNRTVRNVEGARLAWVRVYESPDAWVTYFGSDQIDDH